MLASILRRTRSDEHLAPWKNGQVTDSRPSVLIFATGGTIGMRQGSQGLAPDPDFPMALEQLAADICARFGADFRINHLNPPIDSANADAETAARIARAVRARVRTRPVRGVVITHGTDTLAYVGARLAFEFDGLGAPVVLTGSQLPHGAQDSDAPANLALAIRTALRAAPNAPTSIAFGGAIVPAVRATKYQAEDQRAFRAERPLGPAASGVSAALRQSADRLAPARVISFRFTPGVTAADLRGAVAGEPDGLVLECYGSGNAPMGRPGMAEALREITARIPVIAVTQCATGSVEQARYAVGSELAATGVLDGADMTLEAALAKLAFALDAGLTGSPLDSLLRLNLVGERGTRHSGA